MRERDGQNVEETKMSCGGGGEYIGSGGGDSE